MAVKCEITGVDDARVIQALSAFPSENEALLPPGTQLKIEGITDREANAAVANPESTYGDDLDQHKYTVQLKVVKAPPAQGQAAPDGDKKVDETDPLALALDKAPPFTG